MVSTTYSFNCYGMYSDVMVISFQNQLKIWLVLSKSTSYGIKYYKLIHNIVISFHFQVKLHNIQMKQSMDECKCNNKWEVQLQLHTKTILVFSPFQKNCS